MNLEIENKRLIEELRAAALLIEFLKEEVHNLGQSSTIDNTNEVIQFSRNSGRYPSLNVIVSPLDGTTLSPTLEILDSFSLQIQKPSSNVSNIQGIVGNHYRGKKLKF